MSEEPIRVPRWLLTAAISVAIMLLGWGGKIAFMWVEHVNQELALLRLHDQGHFHEGGQ